VAVVVFAAVGGTLFYFGERERKAKVVELLGASSECLAGGYYSDREALAVALRHRQLEFAGVEHEAAKWPQLCAEGLAQLQQAASDYRDDEVGERFTAAAGLNDAAAEPATAGGDDIALAPLGTALEALWQAAEAAGIDVKGSLKGGPPHERAAIQLAELIEGPALTQQPLAVEVPGGYQNDGRQDRLTLKDFDTGDVLGFCSLTRAVSDSSCLLLPKALRHPKTQLLGYSEPGVAPLVYARNGEGTWSVFRGSDGKSMLSGYAGGAWTAKDYAAVVTDDEGRDDRIVVVEQRGSGPITRRVIELAELDPDAKRVGQAIVIWQHVLLRTTGDDASARSVFVLPLPLPSGKVPATKLNAGDVRDFCRSPKGIEVVHDAGQLAFHDGRWAPVSGRVCAAAPLWKDAGPKLFGEGGAIWMRLEGAPRLVVDPSFVAGKFVDESPMQGWSSPSPGVLLLESAGRSYLLQVKPDGSVHKVPARS
jgi:hypothetical protein